MRFRKLRIAFSATCLTACVLLIVLWLRSYYVADSVFMRVSTWSGYFFVSTKGQLALRRETIDAPGIGFYGNMGIPDWVWSTYPGALPKFPTRLGFDVWQLPYFIALPYWAPLLVCGVLAAMPFLIRRSFSLRTLLIATTLMAVVLGMIVYMLRTKPVLQPSSTPTIKPVQINNTLFGAMPPRPENNFPATHS
jgi:hypothetical protein